jgi:hypothetical protein
MKKNITLVCTLLFAVCLKAQTAVNISGANTATWTALSFHSLFKGLKQINQKSLFSFLLSIVAGFFCQGDAQTKIIYGASYIPCAPSEQVTVPFTAAGQTTTNLYSGLVLIKVSGTGISDSEWPNDAFYICPQEWTWHHDNLYQLAVTVEGSVKNNSDDAAYRHIVYDVSAGTAVTPPYTPAYRDDHTYEFIVDLSSLVPAVAEPSAIRFGVIDEWHGDNSGSYTVQITQLCCLSGGVGTVFYEDADHDGYGNPSKIRQACLIQPGYVTDNTDCDDNNINVNPLTRWFKDADNDGVGDGTYITQCDRLTGYKLQSELFSVEGDCNDADALINPGTIWYKDADNDGYSDGSTTKICERPTGYKLASELTATSGDCDDTKASINPATVWYKDADNDGYSDGTTKTQCTRPGDYKLASELTATSSDCDDSDPSIKSALKWYKDADNDGYSDGTTATQCARPTGYKLASELTATSGDCDDTNGSLNPATVWYKDADNDGYSDGTTANQCTRPTGYKRSTELTSTDGDCNDNDVAINPKTLWVLDNDKDGYYFGNPVMQCSSPGTGYVIKASQQAGDCSDNNAGINPDAVEVCGNGIDDNCNGKVDEAGCALCANGTGLTTTNITSSGATLKWIALANPVQWEIEYKKVSTGSKWTTITLPGYLRSYTISSLVANQNYNWHIRAKCNKTWTVFSNTISFKTSSTQQTNNTITQARPLNVTEEESQSLKLYPNPSKGQFMIELHLAPNINAKARIELVNMMGQTVSTNNASINNGTLYKNVSISSSLAAGMYIARITVHNKTYTTKLFYEK